MKLLSLMLVFVCIISISLAATSHIMKKRSNIFDDQVDFDNEEKLSSQVKDIKPFVAGNSDINDYDNDDDDLEDESPNLKQIERLKKEKEEKEKAEKERIEAERKQKELKEKEEKERKEKEEKERKEKEEKERILKEQKEKEQKEKEEKEKAEKERIETERKQKELKEKEEMQRIQKEEKERILKEQKEKAEKEKREKEEKEKKHGEQEKQKSDYGKYKPTEEEENKYESHHHGNKGGYGDDNKEDNHHHHHGGNKGGYGDDKEDEQDDQKGDNGYGDKGNYGGHKGGNDYGDHNGGYGGEYGGHKGGDHKGGDKGGYGGDKGGDKGEYGGQKGGDHKGGDHKGGYGGHKGGDKGDHKGGDKGGDKGGYGGNKRCNSDLDCTYLTTSLCSKGVCVGGWCKKSKTNLTELACCRDEDCNNVQYQYGAKGGRGDSQNSHNFAKHLELEECPKSKCEGGIFNDKGELITSPTCVKKENCCINKDFNNYCTWPGGEATWKRKACEGEFCQVSTWGSIYSYPIARHPPSLVDLLPRYEFRIKWISLYKKLILVFLNVENHFNIKKNYFQQRSQTPLVTKLNEIEEFLKSGCSIWEKLDPQCSTPSPISPFQFTQFSDFTKLQKFSEYEHFLESILNGSYFDLPFCPQEN